MQNTNKFFILFLQPKCECISPLYLMELLGIFWLHLEMIYRFFLEFYNTRLHLFIQEILSIYTLVINHLYGEPGQARAASYILTTFYIYLYADQPRFEFAHQLSIHGRISCWCIGKTPKKCSKPSGDAELTLMCVPRPRGRGGWCCQGRAWGGSCWAAPASPWSSSPGDGWSDPGLPFPIL